MKGCDGMLSEKEIEFKNLLTKQEFDTLLTEFHVTKEDFHSQTNYYFDTPEKDFQKNKIGFRLRVMEGRNEITLKTPLEDHVMEEQTIFVTDQERDKILRESIFPTLSFLEKKNLPYPTICIGSIKTNRAFVEITDGTLFFDHSFYSQIEDYEVEYESQDIENGQAFFLQLLKQHQIPVRKTDKKIARLVKTLKG